MNIEALSQKPLIVVSGKGGVGKTTVACALGIRLSLAQKKVLLVEMNGAQSIGPLFGLERLSYKPLLLAPGLFGLSIQPTESLREYLHIQLKVKSIVDWVLNNKLATSFLKAIPGLAEMLMIGKIYGLAHGISEEVDTQHYDHIIVDGPATGHGLSAFAVPGIVSKAVRRGPLYVQAEDMLKFFRDPLKTAYVVVTLPEEMPLTEAAEMIMSIRDDLLMSLGPVFINRISRHHFVEKDRVQLNQLQEQCESGKLALQWLDRQKRETTQIKKFVQDLHRSGFETGESERQLAIYKLFTEVSGLKERTQLETWVQQWEGRCL